MTDWVRLWHDMPTDPKWRVIARKSGQPLPCVLSVFTLMLTNASANSAERGTLLAWDDEDAAAALDMDEADVLAIRHAMQGKVLDGERLTGWERRQPKREDNSTDRVKAYRERQKTANPETKRDETQCNAPDTETETEKNNPPKPPRKRGGEGKHLLPSDWVLPAVAELPEKARACAEQWTAESYETHGEAFVSYWRGEGKMKSDWRLTWANRIVDIHSKVMRDQKFGNAPTSAPNDVDPRKWTAERRAEYARKWSGAGPPGQPIGDIARRITQQPAGN